MAVRRFRPDQNPANQLAAPNPSFHSPFPFLSALDWRRLLRGRRGWSAPPLCPLAGALRALAAGPMASDPRAPFLSIFFSAWSGVCHGQLVGGGGTTACHLAGVRAHQRVSVQPSSGRAMVLEPSHRAAAGIF